jgi:nickel-dependent lactate racemase
MKIQIPYGKEYLVAEVPEARITQFVESQSNKSEVNGIDLVKQALSLPFGSEKLSQMAQGKKTACIITSDHTRPVPSKLTLPLLLQELRQGNEEIDITILVATGCHRASTERELLEKFGEKIVKQERIVIHNSDAAEEMEYIGLLPSGGKLLLNRIVLQTELLLAEGFIEPHFFAGFSGGRKSILPGVAARETVMYNHNAEFINNEKARAGILSGNPIHIDMEAAAEMAQLKFILNVVLDKNKNISAVFAGEPQEAHSEGCKYLARQAGALLKPTPIVITTNGGYPLDQNLYQCVKGITTAESACLPGGVIILAAACNDGHGGKAFYQVLKSANSPQALLQQISERAAADTLPDQWQYQILARILTKQHVIIVTEPKWQTMIEEMHLHYAQTVEAALQMAEQWVNKDSDITVIPDGVSVYTKEG